MSWPEKVQRLLWLSQKAYLQPTMPYLPKATPGGVETLQGDGLY